MPGNVTQSQGQLQVLKINNFSAGIVSAVNSSKSIFAAPNSGQNITFTNHSYGVYGLPAGGLLFGPTPYYTDTPSLTVPSGYVAPYVSGVARGDGYLNGDYQYYLTMVSESGAGQIVTAVYQFSAAQAPGSALYTNGTAVAYAGNFLSYPFVTTMTDGTGYFSDITWTIFTNSVSNSQVYYYGSEGGGAYSGIATNGFAISANGRVWYIAQALGSGLPIYSAIDYTNPTLAGTSDNHAFNAAVTLIDYDNPSSFGAWGCISSANTLLVKANFGGVLTSGDIFSPTISRAPSVQGTNGLIGNACQTPLGLVYRSNNQGIWAWSGETFASKISQNVNDFDMQSMGNYAGNISYVAPTYASVPNSIYNIQYISNMIMTDGGKFYDPNQNAWWNLPPYLTNSGTNVGNTYPCFYAETVPAYGSFQTFWFGSPGSGGVFQATYYSFDVSASTSKSAHYAITPPTGYFGSYIETNPIQLTLDDAVEVQEINLVIQGTGELTVACLGYDGATLSSKSIGVANAHFSRVRMTVDFITDVLVLQIGWTNSQSSGLSTPILESVEIKYTTGRYPIKVAN